MSAPTQRPWLVGALHRATLAGLPPDARAPLERSWTAHVDDALAAGVSGRRVVLDTVRAMASHVSHQAVSEPLLVPPVLTMFSQCLGVVIVALLLVAVEVVAAPATAVWVVGGCITAVCALHHDLRQRTWLLLAVHAVGLTGCALLVWQIDGNGVDAWCMRIGFVNFIVISAVGLAEWMLQGSGEHLPRSLDVLLKVALFSSANLLAFGIAIASAEQSRWWVTTASLVLSVVAVFGSVSVLRLRERYGTLFGPRSVDATV